MFLFISSFFFLFILFFFILCFSILTLSVVVLLVVVCSVITGFHGLPLPWSSASVRFYPLPSASVRFCRRLPSSAPVVGFPRLPSASVSFLRRLPSSTTPVVLDHGVTKKNAPLKRCILFHNKIFWRNCRSNCHIVCVAFSYTIIHANTPFYGTKLKLL